MVVVEHVTSHGKKGVGTKTTLYVGQEEEEEEDQVEEVGEEEVVGGRRREDKTDHPLMISVQKVRIRPGKVKGTTHGWFPQPLT